VPKKGQRSGGGLLKKRGLRGATGPIAESRSSEILDSTSKRGEKSLWKKTQKQTEERKEGKIAGKNLGNRLVKSGLQQVEGTFSQKKRLGCNALIKRSRAWEGKKRDLG